MFLGMGCRILILVYNTASCRVLEKAGFQYEGTLRKHAVKNGQVFDMKLYSLLREER